MITNRRSDTDEAKNTINLMYSREKIFQSNRPTQFDAKDKKGG